MMQRGEEETGDRAGEEERGGSRGGEPSAQAGAEGQRPGYFRSWDWDINKLA